MHYQEQKGSVDIWQTFSTQVKRVSLKIYALPVFYMQIYYSCFLLNISKIKEQIKEYLDANGDVHQSLELFEADSKLILNSIKSLLTGEAPFKKVSINLSIYYKAYLVLLSFRLMSRDRKNRFSPIVY